MSTDYLEIAATPSEEPCAQVGATNYDYAKWARVECKAYANQLRRVHGEEPEGASLITKSNPHDFGTYYEVACKYDDSNSEAEAYAWEVEGGTPDGHWDEEAIQELKDAGYPYNTIIGAE